MIRFIHTADLHLSASERDYSLAVFRELAEACLGLEVHFLLISGDLFDTHGDALALRGELREILGTPPFPILYIPGNHEELRSDGADLRKIDLGPLSPVTETPFRMVHHSAKGTPVEFLCIPHQKKLPDYRLWDTGEKRASLRVALAHGVVPEMIAYTGPEDEEGGATLEADLFRRHRVDYAALGHIHSRRIESLSGVTIAYPGSARVWRKGEEGDRGFYLVEADPSPRASFVPLASAGHYRRMALPLSPDGRAEHLDGLAHQWNASDFVELELSGVLEDETLLAALERDLRRRFESHVRRLEISRDAVIPVQGIQGHPLASRFLKLWERSFAESPERDRELWLLARQEGLREISEMIRRQQ